MSIYLVILLLGPRLILCQISLQQILSRHPHPADDPPPDASQHLYLPTLIVPGSIEYRTTIDGVVIKFTTGDSDILTRITPSTTSPTMITPTQVVHEGTIQVVESSIMRRMDQVFESQQLLLASTSPSDVATPQLPSHPSVDLFPSLESSLSSPIPPITPSLASSSSSSSVERVWRTKYNGWKTASGGGSSDKRSIVRSKATSSGRSPPSSRDRIRMNRLKLKVTNSEQLYDICLKDVCLRGQMPEGVLLLISGSHLPNPPSQSSSILSPSLTGVTDYTHPKHESTTASEDPTNKKQTSPSITSWTSASAMSIPSSMVNYELPIFPPHPSSHNHLFVDSLSLDQDAKRVNSQLSHDLPKYRLFNPIIGRRRTSSATTLSGDQVVGPWDGKLPPSDLVTPSSISWDSATKTSDLNGTSTNRSYFGSHESFSSSPSSTSSSSYHSVSSRSTSDPLTAEGNHLFSRTTHRHDFLRRSPVLKEHLISISMSSADMTNMMPLIHFDFLEPSPTQTTSQVPLTTHVNQHYQSYLPMITLSITSPEDGHLQKDIPFGNRLRPRHILIPPRRKRRPDFFTNRWRTQKPSITSASATATPALPSSKVQRVLKSVVETRVLAVKYNPTVTKYRTITHTKYFSSEVTKTISPTIHGTYTQRP